MTSRSRFLRHSRPAIAWAVLVAVVLILIGYTNGAGQHRMSTDSDDLVPDAATGNRAKPRSVAPPPYTPQLGVPPFVPSNVNVSNLIGNESEVSIAVNPTNPLNMVIAGHAPDLATLNTFYTLNGGQSWTLVTIDSMIDDVTTCERRVDPTVAFDDDGHVYVGYFTTECDDESRTLFVARSVNGGQSYVTPATIVLDDPDGGIDKDILGTGPDPSNPSQQNVYMAYRLNVGTDAQLHVAASFDSGASFPTDVIVNDESVAGDDFASFGVPAAGPNGEVYVVWDDFSSNPVSSRIMVDVSTDGGATWGTDVEIATTPITCNNANGFSLPPLASVRYHIPAQPDRGILAVPSIAVDRSGGSNTGRIYVAYTTLDGGGPFDTDIVLQYSDDQAASWSSPVPVSDDAGFASQFLPWVSVDNGPAGSGRVAVAWLDARSDVNNQKVQTFLGVSDDGTVFDANIQVSSGQSDQSLANSLRTANNYLEYLGVAVVNDTACVVWPDNSVDPGDMDFFSDCVPLVDVVPPMLAVSLDPDTLWPPNHKLVEVTATVTVTDNADPSPAFVLTDIYADEPDNSNGDGNTTDDIQGAEFGTPDVTFLLRAERRGPGDGRKYYVVYTAVDDSGNSLSDTSCVVVPHDRSGTTTLSSIYPNPFNPSATIEVDVATEANVLLDIFDVMGRHIRTLRNERMRVGIHSIEWDGIDDEGQAAPTGTYFVRLRAGSQQVSRKIVLLK